MTETSCEPPSPRSSATFIGSPSNSKELFLFGGEYYNGALATFFNDLFIYNIDKDEWRKVTSPNSPLPRSGHAWCRGGNLGGVYLFGGEFSSPKQGTFYHYNDFWRLEPSTREWTRIENKGIRPPARSGHRLVYYKNYIILFGGFQDTSQQTKYLQDLWIYDCHNFMWHIPALPPATQRPDPRSSFSFHPHEQGAVLFGGYSRVKTNVVTGKQAKGASQVSKSTLKPLVHQDMWFLRVVPPPSEASTITAPAVRWDRRKKPTNVPLPPRAGATQTYHKGRGIMFGGVHDVEESEEGIESEFFDQLFALNLERNRFYPLTLRRTRTASKKQTDDRATKRGRGKADEADLLRNLAALELKGSIAATATVDTDSNYDSVEEMAGPAKPVLTTMPHPRFNAHLAIQGDILFIWGGTYEKGDKEYTFDEMYAIDLGKLDGVQEIYRKELENWLVDEPESGSGSEEEDESEDDSGDEGSSGVALPASTLLTAVSETTQPDEESSEAAEENQPESMVADRRPHPRPFESLRDFFARTSSQWQEHVLENLQCQNSVDHQSIKEMRTIAFQLAETKWWDCREEITAEEERQEEAGIGELISITDRSGDIGALGRRR